MVEQKAVPAPEPADDVLFADEGKPEPEPQPAPKPAVSIEDVDLGEPELASQESTAPRSPLKAMPPPAAHWVAPAGSTVADSLVAALEGVGQSAAVSGEPAPAASALSSWFSEPEGTREEPGARRRPTLADLAVSSVTEDEEIEILTVNVEEPAAPAKPLPEIPLFSDLSQDAFIELTSQCALKRCTAGEVVIAQGSVGSSFFILTSGTVKVVRAAPPSGEVVLARLTEGSFFGEMALLSGAPRAASVVAEDEAECLEISAELLANLTKKWPHVGQALKKFCRQRLLANVMATSPLFKPFDKDDRKALVEKFKAREVLPGETILVEGQQVDGLYVVMAGEVEVKKKKDDGEVTLASLREGEVFGEISLLTKSAATATVAAIRASTILRLPRSTFDEVISTHPQILALVSELSDDRLKAQQAFEQSKADGLLLL
jgi:CRP-like cAMP-binding protein